MPGVYAGYVHAFLIGDAFDKGLSIRMGQTHVQRLLPELLNHIENGDLQPDAIITHRLPLNEAARGYEIFNDKAEDCRKVVLIPGMADNALARATTDAALVVESPRNVETPRKGPAMDAITLLKKDHTTVRALLEELEGTTSRGVKKRATLLEKIASVLKAHTTIEEEIFYPAFKAAGKKSEDDKMYFEALEEHRAAGDLVLTDLQGTDPASEKFSGRAKVLKELVDHHAGEEEREMFPRAKQLMSKQDLIALGDQMATRKEELLAATVD